MVAVSLRFGSYWLFQITLSDDGWLVFNVFNVYLVKESYCISTLNHRLMDGVLKSCSRNLYEVVVVF